MPTDKQTWENWFRDVWADREDRVYRELFGDIGNAIHTIPSVLFERMGFKHVDERWLVHGVFESAPNETHKSWLYVTSSLSNPWGADPETIDPTQPSGLGFELVLQTPRQESWAIQVLHWLMAIQILAASGMVKGDTVQLHDRVPLQTSIDPATESAMRHLIICEPEPFAKQFGLPSGTVDLLLCVGMTDAENEFAREHGALPLLQLLREQTDFPVTDSSRTSVQLP
ncbi:MAG: suppressor of fused domain protein [Candidatus Sumerlaeaceae bacterium]